MTRWDDSRPPVRRFNPLSLKTILIGALVYMTITISYILFVRGGL